MCVPCNYNVSRDRSIDCSQIYLLEYILLQMVIQTTSRSLFLILKVEDHSASKLLLYLDPVVQSIVSLTISLRHKLVKQISAKVQIHCYFLLKKKCENPLHFLLKKNVRILCSAKDSHIFSTKNNSVICNINV